MIAIKKILVATDFSPVSDTALVYGRSLARTFGGSLHVVHVVDDLAIRLAYADASVAGFSPREMQADLERAARKSLDQFVSETDRRELGAVTVLRVNNNAAQEICDYAKEAGVDLIVIGATGRGAIDRMLMGSVADKVIRRATCPVLAVRHPEHEFVVPDALKLAASTPTKA
ncbi:MAG TPA: universal stress protein [Vicinamibacterales bacterium]|jgi:nucleotide-binding universal stress UspA family protein|nr:universal stress protein [Vicinamibacterales bacterium]